MASASDKTVFEESVEGQDNVNLFESKKWTYITDSSSTNGQFNGQLQFDLNTLSSQNQWTDLSQAVITFPVKLTIKNGSTATAPTTCAINAATIKNGFHQFVDSVQIVIGGTTVQSSQIFTNIDTNYKILTEFSQDTLKKWGPTLGIALDDINVKSDTFPAATESLDNNGLVTVSKGFDLQTSLNSGLKQRLNMFNNSSASTLGKSILSTNQSIIGKSNVQVNAAEATAHADVFVMHALGTIRLKDISDAISKMPVVKGLKGFIYLNYNSTSHTLAGSTVTLSAAPTNIATFGRCAPAVLNLVATDGFSLGATTNPVFTADISATASATLTTATSIQTNAMLYAPYYIATPEVDRALTFKKTIRYNERFVTQFNIGASGNYTATLSPGISNPKRVILYPYFTGAGTSGNSGFLANPLLSPFDGSPSTTSPFAALKDLQLYVGNVPMFQQPISMDWQTFSNEVAQNGLDGGLVDQASSGLLSQKMWNQLYRYYTCDIGRRMNSEDGASKSIQIQCTNATTCPMTVVAIIWYEREITLDSASGMVMQSM